MMRILLPFGFVILLLTCAPFESKYDKPPSFVIDSTRSTVFNNDTVIESSLTIVCVGNEPGNLFRWRTDSTQWSDWDGVGKDSVTILLPSNIDTGLHTVDIQTCYDPSNPPVDSTIVFYRASGPWIIDVDSNVYNTIAIGSQTWTVENLRVTRYNDGESIPEWTNPTTEGYCFYNDSNDTSYNHKWGALYNWHAVNTGKLAPKGWHVPTDAEWDTLQNFLIANGYNWDKTTSGNKIAKSMAAQTDWDSNDTTGTIGNGLNKNNSSGFSALPGGHRNVNDGSFIEQNQHGFWWSASDTEQYARYRRLSYNSGSLNKGYRFKGFGFSVRLLRDQQ